MKHKIMNLAIIISLGIWLCACGHEHEWIEATCTEPRTCRSCGETEGEALGHEWVDASCTAPKTCLRCGETEGDALGHNIVGASCTVGGTCSICGESVAALGHEWIEATCTTPRTCSVCGEKEGDVLGHTTTSGICERCGVEIYEPIVYSGSGDLVISDIVVPEGIYRVTLTNKGERNFIVKAYDASGNGHETWANEIGSYSGAVILTDNIDGGIIEVKSKGDWTITLENIDGECTSNISGYGDVVTPWFTLDRGALVVTLAYDGKSNFIVKVYDEYGKRYSSLANEIGSYDGQVVFNKAQEGVRYWLEVTAEGPWTVDFGLGENITNLE